MSFIKPANPAEVGTILYAPKRPSNGLWVPCDGSLLPQASFPALAAKLGTLSSANNGETFASLWGATTTYGVIYDPDRRQFVMFGNNKVATSPDGVNWTVRTPGYNIISMAYGNGMYVGSKSSTGSDRIVTSYDAHTWTVRNDPQGSFANQVSVLGLSYGQGMFVGVSNVGNMVYSTNGINWYTRSIPQPPNGYWMNCTFFANNLWLAGGYSGHIITSPDGVTWTQRTAPSNVTPGDVSAFAYGNGKFICASNGWGQGTIATSTDGFTWSNQSGLPFFGVFALVFANGRFFAYGDGAAATSVDGITWTSITPTFTGYSKYHVATSYDKQVMATQDNGNFRLSPLGGVYDQATHIRLPQLDAVGENRPWILLTP